MLFFFLIFTRYILLGILAFIILLNVLIAVVVDTYGAVKQEDSQAVFWTSRLEFATEVVVLKRGFKSACYEPLNCSYWNTCLENWWNRFNTIFDDKRPDYKSGGRENITCGQLPICGCRAGSEDSDIEFIPCLPFLGIFFLRLFALIILAIWVVIGAISAGLLWPPQVRKWLWGSLEEEYTHKKTIQEIKRNVTLEDEESTLEVKLDSILENFEKRIATLQRKFETTVQEKNDEISGKINQILDLLKNKD
jgi:hypothetical protein